MTFDTTPGGGTITLEYKPRGAANYTSIPPVAVGNYTVRATLSETANYTRAVDTADFVLAVASGVLTIKQDKDSSRYREPLPQTHTESNNGGTVILSYKKRGAPDNTYIIRAPGAIYLFPGEYTMRGILLEKGAYTSDTAYDDFVILKAIGILNIKQDTGYYNRLKPPDILFQSSDGKITFTYKLRTDGDDAYDIIPPVDVGNYTLRGILAETDTFTSDTAIVHFVIMKAPGEIVIEQDAGYFGSPLPDPVVLQNNSGGNVTFFYKPVDGVEEDYTQTKPRNAGEYILMGVLESTTNYTSGSTTVNFAIIDTICKTKQSFILYYWDNLVTVNRNPATNGGYILPETGYQWWENGYEMPGVTGSYIFIDHSLTGYRYMVQAGSNKGKVYSCLLIASAEPPLASVHSQSLKVYPNPVTSGKFTVETSALQADDKIEICNINGIKLREYMPTGDQTVIYLNDLLTGVYVVRAGRNTAIVVME
jgi:hypothetical protein